MKAKEKTKELYNKMYKISKGELQYPNMIVSFKAKQCALIAVDEILEQLNTMREKFNETEMLGCGNNTLGKMNYWEEVKEEITKL